MLNVLLKNDFDASSRNFYNARNVFLKKALFCKIQTAIASAYIDKARDIQESCAEADVSDDSEPEFDGDVQLDVDLK